MPQLPNKNIINSKSSQLNEGWGSAKLLSVLCLILIGMAIAVANQQNIIDWWKLRNYIPPAQVAQFSRQDTMTDYAKKVFYINQPAIEDKSGFGQHCPQAAAEKTIVLGCYRGGQNGIYILKVDDSRLDGVMQVTAAHEMLHAAYERLSKEDRSKVDNMLRAYYQSGLSDKRIKDTIEAYKVSEPKDVVNEMHSIFGTEVSKLPAGLEAYYRQYFSNRAQVAGFAAKYQSAFTSRRQALDSVKSQLDTLRLQIDNSENQLKQLLAEIETDRGVLDVLKQTNPSEYNSRVPGFNALVDQYNSRVSSAQALINRYNSLVEQYKAIALEEGQLIDELKGIDQIKK